MRISDWSSDVCSSDLPAHEARLAAIAAELGFTQISTSHDVSALIKLIGRGDTTLADAYLSPVLRHYADQFVAQLGDGINPQFMKSSGGLASDRKSTRLNSSH